MASLVLALGVCGGRECVLDRQQVCLVSRGHSKTSLTPSIAASLCFQYYGLLFTRVLPRLSTRAASGRHSLRRSSARAFPGTVLALAVHRLRARSTCRAMVSQPVHGIRRAFANGGYCLVPTTFSVVHLDTHNEGHCLFLVWFAWHTLLLFRSLGASHLGCLFRAGHSNLLWSRPRAAVPR